MASGIVVVASPAARVFFTNSYTYRSIVALNVEGLGAMRIGKILHVSPMVLAVRDREPEFVAIEKDRLANAMNLKV